jgi:hypothetical protein
MVGRFSRKDGRVMASMAVVDGIVLYKRTDKHIFQFQIHMTVVHKFS